MQFIVLTTCANSKQSTKQKPYSPIKALLKNRAIKLITFLFQKQ